LGKVVQKKGYLGVLQERKTVINVPQLSKEGCLGLFGSHIYGPGGIYLKNEAAFGFDLGWDSAFIGERWRYGDVEEGISG